MHSSDRLREVPPFSAYPAIVRNRDVSGRTAVLLVWKSGEDWNGLFQIFSYRNQIILMYPDFYYKSFTSSRLQNAFDTLIAFKIHREKQRLLNYHFG